MPSITYDSIYKRALSRITDLELATYTEEDFYDYMKEWLHSAASSTLLRKKFSKFSLDDEIMTLTFELSNSVDENYDSDFVISTLAKGLIINYFPQKLEHNDIKWITPAEILNYNFCPADEEILKKIKEKAVNGYS